MDQTTLKNLLFIGDSITDCSRARPVGCAVGLASNLANALGSGYVSLVDAMLVARHPDKQFNTFNMGCNGHRITDLAARWQSDVLDLSPTLLIIFIGINDVWRQFDRPLDKNQVDLKQFTATYHAIVEQSITQVEEIMLVAPYFLQPNPNDPMRIMMLQYAKKVAQIAAQWDLACVDLQAVFDQFMKFRDPASISQDKIHLNKIGHMMIADAVYQQLDKHILISEA
ncbi:MAG: SGNH/GDSL hydrolase family protein [Enterobacterales bacterium]|nr:SGNH/GDSL hydrolase family protein [Enterobacterales bacterium]